MNDIFLGEFTSRDDVIFAFDIAPSDLDACEPMVAWYIEEGYEGYALVVYLFNGKLYEVNGSHCSCYGLEGQWEPEEVVLAEALPRWLREPPELREALEALVAWVTA